MDTFTFADMRRLYEQHSDALGWYEPSGEGPFSANPADYWQLADTDTLDGYLAVVHSTLDILT